MAPGGAQTKKNQAEQEHRQPVGQLRGPDAGLWDGLGPIMLSVVGEGLAQEPLLQIIEFAAIFWVLLSGGEQAALEVGVARFDLTSQLMPIGFSSAMSERNNKRRSKAEQGGYRQRQQ